MNYQSLYNYVYDISQNLEITAKFFHGRKDTLIATTVSEPLYVFSLPFISTGSVTTGQQVTQVWEINLIFYMQDQVDSNIDQNGEDVIQGEIKTLTVTDQAADRFIRLFNGNELTSASDKASQRLSIQSFTKGNDIKWQQWLTGTTLSMRVRVPDNFNYCSIDDLT